MALAGLRLLPNQNDARKNQAPMLQALLRHAVKAHHEAGAVRTFFDRHFAALRGLFPRGPQHWNRALDEALSGFLEHTNESMARELADALRADLRASPQAERHRPSTGRSRMPPPKEGWVDLKDDILHSDHPAQALARRLFEILERSHVYAEATGVSHFYVRTLHNLGNALLDRHARHPLAPADMARFGVMIERALVWEPADPYCWMLWVEWFKAQGRRDAQEATLREMVRLFPGNLPARVELARLLIDRGDAGRDEAEHHLRNAMDSDPGDGHSYVVMARLLALRDRGAEAETMLAEFLGQYPDNAIARELLDRLRAGTYPDTAAPAFDAAGDGEIQEWVEHDGPRMSPSGVLEELLRRGRLAGEFSYARIAMERQLAAPTTDMIRRESRKGDPLAGFYSQWLMPAETPESPPHAWAWQACRVWQRSADPDDWQGLAAQFPESAPETDFLRVLAAPDAGDRSGPTGWRDRYCSGNNGASRPVDAFMREAQERLVGADSHERDELACTLMACAAADALGVAWESAA